MSLFDVALHYNIFNASQAGADYDLRTILDGTLVRERPNNAVTFVDNHDTQHGQSLQSFIEDWFKPLAYALVLLRQEGVPCVFYSDYYGNPVKNRPLVPNLGKLIKLRRFYAYGEQEDSFEDPHLIGWVRRGDLPAKPSAMCSAAAPKRLSLTKTVSVTSVPKAAASPSGCAAVLLKTWL